MRKLLLALIVAASLPALARAEDNFFKQDKTVAQSSGTVRIVSISSSAFTLVDTSTTIPGAYSAFVKLVGSDYMLLQSSDAVAGFCCSYESDATTSVTAGAKGCTQAQKEPGGNFYFLELRRWWQNLSAYCIGLKTTSNSILRVTQSK